MTFYLLVEEDCRFTLISTMYKVVRSGISDYAYNQSVVSIGTKKEQG